MAFKKGNKLASGGVRPNSGRPHDWMREKCQELIKKHKLFDWLADVASGNDVDMEYNSKGEKVPCPADTKDRLKAAEMLMDRGFGKPIQDVRPVDDEGKFMPYSITVKIDDGKIQ